MNISSSAKIEEKLLRIQRVPAAEAVLQSIRTAISNDTFLVGSKLPSEAKLGSIFGVSRPVIRESLLACAALGLTETRTGSGTYVISKHGGPGLKLGRYTAGELHEARPHIEMPAAALAAQNRTAEDLSDLASVLSTMQELTAETTPGGVTEWVRLDAKFHSLVARASKNGVFESITADIREAISQQSGMLVIASQRQQHSSDLEHVRIFEAIQAGDAESALSAMGEHLQAVAEAVAEVTNGLNLDY